MNDWVSKFSGIAFNLLRRDLRIASFENPGKLPGGLIFHGYDCGLIHRWLHAHTRPGNKMTQWHVEPNGSSSWIAECSVI